MRSTGEWHRSASVLAFSGFYLQAYGGLKDDARDPLFRTRPGSALRLGKWKLHEFFEDGAELYDLSRDRGERAQSYE